ncbi:lipid droplet-associated hydrolase isoform X4 [Myotis daubentonii]|uniref:lipid droplet-associated hydrolase isoform X4 n=1 Tax=Myotis daubentonii TaxID=98922 RepID=UPI002873B7C9|nr:lipid droplet-associated hydrolase isoform X4 [Myotis daubentonii]
MNSEIKEEIPVHEEFTLCCGVETQVLKCGPWTNLFNDQSANRPKLLIFIIPGNPGFSAFYVPFAKALYSAVNRRFPVWIISHAGHVLAPKDKKILAASDDPNAQEIKDIYGLRGQVEHKVAFLRTHVPKETKLVVIGHSIGSYFALQILKHAPELPNPLGLSWHGEEDLLGGSGRGSHLAGPSAPHQTHSRCHVSCTAAAPAPDLEHEGSSVPPEFSLLRGRW